MKKLLRLNIGCGGVKLNGYVNLDIVDENGAADELLDCTNILALHPEWKETVEEIIGMHVFEHFYLDDARRAVRQFHDLLINEGTVILEMPDFSRLSRMIANGQDDDLTLGYIFGSHSRNGQTHYWGWTRHNLEDLFITAGFSKVVFCEPQDYHAQERPCMRIEVTK